MRESFNGFLSVLAFLEKLVELENKKISKILQKTNSVKTFGTSVILSWFSSELTDVSKVAKIFNFLIIMPPSAVIYLSAACLLMPKFMDAVVNDDNLNTLVKLRELLIEANIGNLISKTIELMKVHPPSQMAQNLPDLLR